MSAISYRGIGGGRRPWHHPDHEGGEDMNDGIRRASGDVFLSVGNLPVAREPGVDNGIHSPLHTHRPPTEKKR